MRRLILFCLTILLSGNLFASHISGGELIYNYLGPGSAPNTDKYRITMRLFRQCNLPPGTNAALLNGERVKIGIYLNPTLTVYDSLLLYQEFVGNNIPTIHNTPGAIPCLTNAITVCYQVGIFSNTIDLPRSPGGYTLSWIRFSRQEIINIHDIPYSSSTAAGATFITEIPGSSQLSTGHNSSPQFLINDTAIICSNKFFKLNYTATDEDDDSLSYSFTPGYNGGGHSDTDPSPPPQLILTPLPYALPYTGTSPLGQSVTIDSNTGIISGTAPPVAGKYVVNVSVKEYRKGVFLGEHRKDFILSIGNCDFTAAVLPEKIVQCNTFSAFFENNSTSSNIIRYYWDFGVTSTQSDTSSKPTPTYVYADTGTYTVTLKVTGLAGCQDSSSTKILVYPGFKANFGYTPGCYQTPYQFTDSTTSKYGKVNGWRWNFGDLTSTSDTSLLKNPEYQYPSPGIDTVISISLL